MHNEEFKRRVMEGVRERMRQEEERKARALARERERAAEKARVDAVTTSVIERVLQLAENLLTEVENFDKDKALSGRVIRAEQKIMQVIGCCSWAVAAVFNEPEQYSQRCEAIINRVQAVNARLDEERWISGVCSGFVPDDKKSRGVKRKGRAE